VGGCFWKAYHGQQKDAKWSPCCDAEQETMVKYGKVWKKILINSVEEVHFVMFFFTSSRRMGLKSGSSGMG
jgi:hypothetical protein